MSVYYERIPKSEGASWYYRVWSTRKFEYPLHFHPEIEFNYLLHSNGIRVVGDSVQRCEPGQFVVLGANLPHYWYNVEDEDYDPPAQSLVCQFREDFLGPTFFNAPEMEQAKRLIASAKRGLLLHGRTRESAARLIRRMRHESSTERLVTLLRMLTTIATAPETDYTVLASEHFVPNHDVKDYERVEKAYGCIFNQYAEQLTLEEVAATVGLSLSAFCRFFKRHAGRTFVDALNGYRITQACKLLANEDLPIVDVAFDVGFNNLAHFYRCFQKYQSITPADFRKRVRFLRDSNHTEITAIKQTEKTAPVSSW